MYAVHHMMFVLISPLPFFSLEPESMYHSFMKTPADITPPPPPGAVAAAAATAAAAVATAEAAPATAGTSPLAGSSSATTPDAAGDDTAAPALDLGGLDVSTVLKGLCEMFKEKHGRDPTEDEMKIWQRQLREAAADPEPSPGSQQEDNGGSSGGSSSSSSSSSRSSSSMPPPPAVGGKPNAPAFNFQAWKQAGAQAAHKRKQPEGGSSTTTTAAGKKKPRVDDEA